MFQFGIGCHICNKSTSDPAFKKDPRTGEILYFVDPKLSPEVKTKLLLCSPVCALEYHKRNEVARNSETSKS